MSGTGARRQKLFCALACALLEITVTTGATVFSNFENGFGDEARQHLGACTDIKDDGARAECSLLAALEAQTKAMEILVEKKGGANLSNSRETCRYRLQGGPLLHRYAYRMPLQLKNILEKYAALHRYCTELEYDDLADMYAHKRKPRCQYVVWSCTFGLGNKLMSLLSTFLYAILSQRILLIENPGWEHLFCEPFLGSRLQKQSVSFLCPVQSQNTSSDRIDTSYNRHIHFDEVLKLEEDLQVPEGFSLEEDMSPSFAKFQAHNCKGSGESYHCTSSSSSYVVEVVISGVSRPADHTFLVCPSAMSAVREIPFLNFRNSNQYFAAGFFLNPALRSLLERMFPAHNVFHILAQTFLSPSDVVWGRIKSFHEQFLRPASRSVGIQLREFKGEYRHYYDDVVPLCIKSKVALCPIELEELKIDRKSSWPLVSLYVSSLAAGHFLTLNQTAPNLESEMRQRFVVLTQGAEGEQREDVGHQQKALVDMWVLSLSDILLTSHMSTFGYTAQGLGGLTPYHLKPWLDNPCWLSVSSDPCFHFAPGRVECPGDTFTMESPLKEAPYVTKCPDLPDTGIQLAE